MFSRTTISSSSPRRRHPLRMTAFAMVAITSLVVAGCSTGGDEADDTTTTVDEATTTMADETTETTEGDETTTTEAADAELTAADLEPLLPAASDIGADYSDVTDEQDDDDSDSSNMDEAMEQACPEASEFFRDEDEDESDAAIRVFETSDGREVEIKLDPTPNPNFGEDVMSDIIDAVNACTTIEVDQGGFAMSIDLEATADDTYGDRGVTMTMAATMTHPQLLAPLELQFSARSYILDSVSVSLSAADGIAGESNDDVQVIPGDHDLLDSIAATLEPGIADLQG